MKIMKKPSFWIKYQGSMYQITQNPQAVKQIERIAMLKL